MKNAMLSLVLLVAAGCSALGIGGEPVEVTADDHATLDKFIDYATEGGRAALHGFLEEETAIAVALRLWKVAVIGSGDPDGIFMPAVN